MQNPVHLWTYEQAILASKYLHALATGTIPEHEHMGICSNLYWYLEGDAPTHALVAACSPSWEGYAGSTEFPVEGDAQKYRSSENKWEGEYAAKRRDLCKYLAERIDKALEEGSW